MANCSKCGFELKPSAKFCETCGARVGAPSQNTQDSAPSLNNIKSEQTYNTYQQQNSAIVPPVNQGQYTAQGVQNTNNQNTNYQPYTAQGTAPLWGQNMQNQAPPSQGQQSAPYQGYAPQGQTPQQNYNTQGTMPHNQYGAPQQGYVGQPQQYGTQPSQAQQTTPYQGQTANGQYMPPQASQQYASPPLWQQSLQNGQQNSAYSGVNYTSNAQTQNNPGTNKSSKNGVIVIAIIGAIILASIIGAMLLDSGDSDTSITPDIPENFNDLFENPQSADDNFSSPEYGEETTIPLEELTNPSQFYGTLYITNYNGYDSSFAGEHEAWGRIDTDVNGTPYFELFTGGPNEDPDSYVFMSFYIELETYTFYPIVDDDAWIHNASLREEDSTWYTPTIENGKLTAIYEYDDGDESFTAEYELSQIDEYAITTTPPQETENNTESSSSAVASFTTEELAAINEKFTDEVPFDVWRNETTYDDILVYTNGVEGEIIYDENGEYEHHRWSATNSDTAHFFVAFADHDTLVGIEQYGYTYF